MLRFLLPAAALLLGACATSPAVEPVAPPPVIESGMEQLLGQPAETALAMLGTPRLDKQEGPARQLQFAGSCILDLWYYPASQSAPLARHADARLVDGRSVSPGACLQMLRAARNAQTKAPAAKTTRKR